MKHPLVSTIGLALFVGISATASASVIIDYVNVGHAGNAADPTTGIGAVAYAYQIGKYEVTNAQYTAFLNAADPGGANANGIYNTNMGSNARGGITYTSGAASGSKYTIRTSMGDKPVNYVSWYDAARFTNWLHNGQGTGSTETGAYKLKDQDTTGIIIKNVGATVWLPSEDEWYKAAYYDPTPGAGGGDNYWFYPTQSDTAPTVASANATGSVSNPGANVANYYFGADWNGQDGNVTTVGSAAANNYFGTADQGGNVFEWNDAEPNPTWRGLLGGSFLWDEFLHSADRAGTPPGGESDSWGVRVASAPVPVPEPSTIVLTMLFSAGLVCHRKR